MSVAAVANVDTNAAEQELTDGFHLVIDALKLNDINTIYAVPGIPISDLCRMAQGEGIRVISFRHEQEQIVGDVPLHNSRIAPVVWQPDLMDCATVDL